ncbi:hypothetical protein C8J57DRAFT_1222664 [Mycena rebaudengoi]|nr:hypothetical protein C8J57DRAFT_1222664 [Mycena rebaudengoi]
MSTSEEATLKGEWFAYVDGGVGVGVSPWDPGAATFNESLPEANPNTNYGTVENHREDIWSNSTAAGASLVPWSISISVENGCYDGWTLLLSVIGSAGVVANHTATDFISAKVISGLFPIHVAISAADSPHDVTVFTYALPTALTFKLGSGPNKPTVPPATLETYVYWCDTD